MSDQSTRMIVATTAVAVAALTAPAVAGSKSDRYDRYDRSRTVVDAPFAYVETDRKRGKSRVRVEAPFTGVYVNERRRRVIVDVPFFSGDFRY